MVPISVVNTGVSGGAHVVSVSIVHVEVPRVGAFVKGELHVYASVISGNDLRFSRLRRFHERFDGKIGSQVKLRGIWQSDGVAAVKKRAHCSCERNLCRGRNDGADLRAVEGLWA